MSITATQVKELRERTGAGMMECKKALVETGGDMEAAVDAMRKSGLAKADKRAGRVAAEGAIVVRQSADNQFAAILEINCETDFVSGGDDFRGFVDAVADAVLVGKPDSMDALMALSAGNQSVEEARRGLVARIGENVQLRRFELIESAGVLASYLHGIRIGVVVSAEGGDIDLARDIAMHVAALSPQCVSEADVPAKTLAREREILVAQARTEGKPEEIVEKMVAGRMRKFLAEITLTGQPFVKDPDLTVGKLLKQNNATVARFVRFEVGEGIDKAEENFADEVMTQVKGA
ncbi:MAG: translation elongation factor Ts [Gammaproteobacteria bacterium]|nr:translation elongation factor Ts [Gammaproteobacteria bacterium]